MQIEKTDIIWEIASKHPTTVSIFLKYWIEFCCKWNISLEDSSKRDGFNLETVLKELNNVLEKIWDSDTEVANMNSIVEIANYVKNTFHNPIRETLYPTEVLAKKVAMVHGSHHPELVQIKEIVEWLVPVLEMHFDKEWQILHPMIAEIQATFDAWEKLKWLHCGSITNPIRQMELEHDNYWDMLLELRKLTSNYTLPEGACRSYTALFANLEKLEEDLMRHTNIENFILHPKTIEMEKSISWVSICGTWYC